MVLIAVTGWGQEEDRHRSQRRGSTPTWSSRWTTTRSSPFSPRGWLFADSGAARSVSSGRDHACPVRAARRPGHPGPARTRARAGRDPSGAHRRGDAAGLGVVGVPDPIPSGRRPVARAARRARTRDCRSRTGGDRRRVNADGAGQTSASAGQRPEAAPRFTSDAVRNCFATWLRPSIPTSPATRMRATVVTGS